VRALGSWLLSLAAVGLFGAVIAAVAPGKHQKTVRFAVGLAVILLVLRPLQNRWAVSLPAELAHYEAEVAGRLRAARGSAQTAAVEMVCAQTARSCELALEEIGILADVTLVPSADGARFLRAEISYEVWPDSDLCAEAAAVITAQTGVAAEDQIHR